VLSIDAFLERAATVSFSQVLSPALPPAGRLGSSHAPTPSSPLTRFAGATHCAVLKQAALIVATVTLGLALVLAAVGDPARWPLPESPPQQGEAAVLHGPTHSSAALARLVREPQNTWSNLAFLMGGAWLVARARRRIIRRTGLALLAVGVGSFLYHASASRVWRQADVTAMNALFLCAATACVATWHGKAGDWIERRAGVILMVSFLAAIVVTAARNVSLFGFKPLSMHLLTALTAALMIISLAETARRRATLRGALALVAIVTIFGVAAACQLNDRPGGRFFRPEWPVQLHAVWHVLAAGAFTGAMRLLDGNPSPPRATVPA
jgi:hypothetical protein